MRFSSIQEFSLSIQQIYILLLLKQRQSGCMLYPNRYTPIASHTHSTPSSASSRPRLLLWMRRPSPWKNGLLRPPPSLQCAHHRMQLPCSAIFLTSSSSSSSSPPLIAYLNARSTTVKIAKMTATYFVTVAATSEYVK